MKALLRVSGILLMLFGLLWIIYVVGAVASHTPGFTSLGELLPALAFHTLVSFAGASLISKSIQRSPNAAQPLKAPGAGSAGWGRKTGYENQRGAGG